jgi:enterochelin esterase-like enzyme
MGSSPNVFIFDTIWWYTPVVRRSLTLIPLVMLFIQSCSPATKPAAQDRPVDLGIQGTLAASIIPSPQKIIKETLSPSVPILPVTTPTEKDTPIILTATSTLTACMDADGHVETEQFTTDLLPEPMVYRIYLPPCYDEETSRYYPVLYLIHGKNASDMQWDYLGVPEALDRLTAKGDLPAFLVVMPRDRIWTEPTVDNFGLAMVQSLIPWVDEHYRTLPEREYRAIGGLSWGGAWALHIGFSHPELFSAVGSHSGIIFSTDVAILPGWLDNFPEGMMPRIYMDIGDEDRMENIMENSWVDSLLIKNDIPHEWHIYKGKHNDAYWRAHLEEYLRWYSQAWADTTALFIH